MSDYSEVTYWLTLIQHSKLKLSLVKPIIQRWCIGDQRPLAELSQLSPLELSTTFGLSDKQAVQISEAMTGLEAQAKFIAQWQAQNIEPIIRTDPRYPNRLTFTLSPAQQPLILWARGAIHLLNQPGVTMLGQKKSDPATEAFITELMSSLEAGEIGLISGYERGLDRATFETMLGTADGYATAILPMGLSAFAKTTNKLDRAAESGRAVLVSPFSPETPYDERLAEARNMLIDHLTLALLIPESDQYAQTRALAALERGLPVFVKADTASNRELLDQGALLLTDPGEVIDWVQQAVVDAALREEDEEEAEAAQEELAAAPLAATAPTEPPASDEDYTLRVDDVPPLDREEAMEILSLGGEIPEILRRRLQKPDDE